MNKIHESTSQLRAAGIRFTTCDAGHRLTVIHNGITVSFWPNSGKFWPHPKKGQRLAPTINLNGVGALITYLNGVDNG